MEEMAKYINMIGITDGQIPLDQKSYDKMETKQPLRLASCMRALPRVYEYISNNSFRITVKVKDSLPPLFIDGATLDARFRFNSDRERQEALSNFVNSLQMKSVLSWSRDSDIFYELPLLKGFGYSEVSIRFLTERMNDWKETWTVRGIADEVRHSIIEDYQNACTNTSRGRSGVVR